MGQYTQVGERKGFPERCWLPGNGFNQASRREVEDEGFETPAIEAIPIYTHPKSIEGPVEEKDRNDLQLSDFWHQQLWFLES